MYHTNIEKLSKNYQNDIAILKANKGRGVVIMSRDKYTEKC